MNQLSEMETYITPIWSERFAEDQSKIYNYFHTHQTEIVFDFCSYAVKRILPDVCYLQSMETQSEIAFLVIHFLKSSLLNKSYDYEIKLYNESLYLDENDVAGYWYPEFLYQFADDEEVFLKKELQRKFIIIKSYEIEILRRKLFSQYWGAAKQYFKILTNCLCERPEFKQVKTNGKLRVLYGEHMGKLEELEPGGDL